MKKKVSLVALASLLPLVASCGSQAEITMPLGDGSVENDAITAYFTLPATIAEGTNIDFTFNAEKDVVFAPSYSFSLFDVNPLMNESYHETELISFKSKALESMKKSDGSYGDYKVRVTFSEISSMFNKDENNEGTMYLVFHTSDWSRRQITKYSYHEISYTHSGDKITIKDE